MFNVFTSLWSRITYKKDIACNTKLIL